ncbi:MAG: precorrin-4 C(11)-methyltransferase [Oscillospiraceae bacterium]|jgi:precorrin-4/cobalt-precorrin-4 C11-methyltransferase|nr:precorrin-4 C(11)-methyltransferase [Oscillospiraceae bacterium]
MVHFVGAGPGAVDLITIRGAELLKRADTLIYTGSLVSAELLDYVKPDCRVFNSANMTLDEVIAVIADCRGDIVRLHTGDPSLYGAIREQMDRLNALGIQYDVCPGVSSFSGAAAALKTEYTLPNVSQSVIITRIAGRTPVPDGESIRGLAAHGATMVIFLSAGMTARLQSELLEGGYREDTPAAIVYKATWSDQRIVRCTVGTLHSAASDAGISNHALICVGGFLGDDYELSKLYDPAFTTAFREGAQS